MENILGLLTVKVSYIRSANDKCHTVIDKTYRVSEINITE